MKSISIIGLGKLGICTAACFASKGFDVLGIDTNEYVVDTVNKSNAPLYEPGLQNLIKKHKARLKATQDYDKAISRTDITFIVVPTPSAKDGCFSDRYVQDSIKALSAALKKSGKRYHLFVITSTVSPGTIEEHLIPLIEKKSGKKLNRDFGVCYNPEFIALGNVIKDFLNPDIVLIGESDKKAGDRLEAIYKKTCDNKPYIAKMSLISAEITKISLNSYITTKISYANTLANICEAVPGADIDDITKALGADKRISPFYLKAGLSYGGPCFPRDNKAFAAFAAKYERSAKLAKATDEVNNLQIENLAKIVTGLIPPDRKNTISVLGLSYKSNTPVIEESPAIKLIDKLLKKGLKIMAYDPLAMNNAKAYFGDNILYAASIKQCLAKSSICVITTQDKKFKLIKKTDIGNNPVTIIDCWRMLDPVKLGKNVKYVALGKAWAT